VKLRAFLGGVLLAVLLPGFHACTSPSTTPPGPAEAVESADSQGGAAITQEVRRPEFHGRNILRVTRGHQLPVLRRCVPAPLDHRVCGTLARLTFAAYGPTRAAVLNDAVMRPAASHTAWLVDLRFSPYTSRVLRQTARRAERTQEFLLLMDRQERVLVPLLPRVRGRLVTVGPVTKMEAWRLVGTLARHGRGR